jgi:hypothetical protein
MAATRGQQRQDQYHGEAASDDVRCRAAREAGAKTHGVPAELAARSQLGAGLLKIVTLNRPWERGAHAPASEASRPHL